MMQLPTVTSLALFALLLNSGYGQGITKCTYDESVCGCKSDKGVITLSKFDHYMFGTNDPIKWINYYWSPCRDGKMGVVEASCVQIVNFSLPEQQHDCGSHKNVDTSVENGTVVFRLDSLDGSRHSSVKCVCKEGVNYQFAFEKEVTPGVFAFNFTSEACCPKNGLP